MNISLKPGEHEEITGGQEGTFCGQSFLGEYAGYCDSHTRDYNEDSISISALKDEKTITEKIHFRIFY